MKKIQLSIIVRVKITDLLRYVQEFGGNKDYVYTGELRKRIRETVVSTTMDECRNHILAENLERQCDINAGSNLLNIEYGITADVVNRDDFTIHGLLDDKNKDKYLKSFINGVIYTCLACYHVLYEKDGYPRFHKTLDINTKNVVINEEPEHRNNIISKIEKALCKETICGVKFTCVISL
jgi:hypothetical protein